MNIKTEYETITKCKDIENENNVIGEVNNEVSSNKSIYENKVGDIKKLESMIDCPKQYRNKIVYMLKTSIRLILQRQDKHKIEVQGRQFKVKSYAIQK